ncbi:MAG: hypothetical protein QOK07_65 [Gemmatimonadaceae bacterium]|nr:hypothetical protein [Gemmatimonadaceae bacterium]
MKRTTVLIAALAITGCTDAAAPPPATDASQVSVRHSSLSGPTTLPSFGGGAVADAINDLGVVVGLAAEANLSRTQAGTSYPVKWTRNATTGAWGVPSRLGTAGGRALALNEAGDAVGLGGGHAIVWPAGGVESLLEIGVAQGINNRQIIVGSSVWGGPPSVAYAWTPIAGTPTTWKQQQLPLLEVGGSATAYAINENSVIAGAATRDGVSQAVIWVPVIGGWSAPILLDGTDAFWSSAVFGINDSGDAVGYARICPPPTCNGRPYVWPVGGGSRDIGKLNPLVTSGWPTGIGNNGTAAGFVTVTRGSSGGPFVWSGGTSLIDLGDGEIHGINNGNTRYGQEAVGFGRTAKGQVAVVWRVP